MRGLLHLVQRGGPERAAAPPSPLIAAPNVTARPSTASLLNSYYSKWHYNCLCLPIKGLSRTFLDVVLDVDGMTADCERHVGVACLSSAAQHSVALLQLVRVLDRLHHVFLVLVVTGFVVVIYHVLHVKHTRTTI